MIFVELLSLLGGMGRFQVSHVAALAVPLLMLASHNLLQNFTAGVPEHHCRPRALPNGTGMADVPLLVSIPSDGQRGLQSCRRYVEPQWHLLGVNGTASFYGGGNGYGVGGAYGVGNVSGVGNVNGMDTNSGMGNNNGVGSVYGMGNVNGMADNNGTGNIYGVGNVYGMDKVNGMDSNNGVDENNGVGKVYGVGKVKGMANVDGKVNANSDGVGNVYGAANVYGMANTNGVASADNGMSDGEAATEPCRDGWVYRDGVFAHTIISEWDLVCEAKSLRQLAQSIYMGGILLGSGVVGILSDKFGRRPLLSWCYLQMGAAGVGTALAPTFLVYCICRFLGGVAMAGVSLNSASLCMEWIPPRSRALVGTLNGYSYTGGQFVLAALAFALPRWRQLQLAASLPFFLFFLYSWFFVESARWQLISGRVDSALRGLRKVARINGRGEEGEKLSRETLQAMLRQEKPMPGGALTALIRTPGMRTVSCGVCFVWFSTSFAYYGLAMDLQGFGVDIYLSQLIFAAVDIPAKLISMLVISGAGRRTAQAAALGLAGICILINSIVPMELRVPRMALAVVGKGALAASFNCAYIFTGELFPTAIRQTGMGLGGSMARVGSMVAPLVRMGADVAPLLPPLVYGAAPIVAAIAAFFLPETRNAPLPETVEDVERRGGHLKDDEVTVPLSVTRTQDSA